MIQEKIMYFSHMTARSFFEKLENNQLLEISTSYYKKTADEIFKNNGYELYFARTESKRRGYRLYRALKIREKTSVPETDGVLQFNPEELVT